MKKILKKIFGVIVFYLVKFFCKIVFRYKVIGKENIPANGNVIFCGNHRSYLDPIFIVLTTGRYTRFMAKEDLKKNIILRLVCYLFDAIYVKRDSKDIVPLKEAIKTLKSGECIGIFPEGTRNGLEKNNGEMKDGASYLALKTSSKIVPIGIKGEPKPFRKNVIIYGTPIDVTEYQSKNKEQEKENTEKLTLIIKEEIIKLTK